MSTFDPTVLEQTVVEEANATRMDPVPEGEYKPAYIDGYKVRSVATKDGDSPMLDVMWKIDDDQLAKKLKRENGVIVRQSIWLDVTDQGALAMGPNKNVQLGRLREAVKMNKPGKPFQFAMLEGAGPCAIYVTQREDPKSPGDYFNDVKRVVPA